MYLKDTKRPPKLIVGCYFLVAVMDSLYKSNAEDTKCIHEMILSDHVCDEHNPGHTTESNGDYVEPKESNLGVCKTTQWMTTAAVK